MRILMVEDARDLAEATQVRLGKSGIACDLAGTVQDARDHVAVQSYDAIILDISLPDGRGTEFLREIRRDGVPAPVLMLTAEFSVDDKLSAFGLGADDYLVKPFDYRELEARLYAMRRRGQSQQCPDVTLGGLTFNAAAKVAEADGRRLDLTRREFALLEMFMQHTGQVLSKERLLDGLYSFDDATVGINAIELYVARLRKKLVDSGVSIHTLRGLGYRLEADG